MVKIAGNLRDGHTLRQYFSEEHAELIWSNEKKGGLENSSITDLIKTFGN